MTSRSQNAANRLSSSFLTPLMVSSVPESADTHLRNAWDAIALFCHASMLAVGFRLVGLREDDRIEESSDSENLKPLPLTWNADPTSSDHSFRYAHTQSALQYMLKTSRLGRKAVIHGLGMGDDKVASFDVPVADFVSEASFPLAVPAHADPAATAQSLKAAFVSEGRMGDLAALMKLHIFQKLVPGIHKEGYEDTPRTSTAAQQRDPDPAGREQDRSRAEDERRRPREEDRPLPPLAQPRPFHEPLADAPRRPVPAGDFPPPGFEDEHEILRPPGGGGMYPERRPLNIGERDLYPPGLGPHDPLRIGGPGAGGAGGGGMHPTFDDPMFGGQGARSGGYDPSAPPGARYDPVGPGDEPPNLRGGPRFPGGPPGGGFGRGGGPPNPFGGFGGHDFI